MIRGTTVQDWLTMRPAHSIMATMVMDSAAARSIQ